MAKVTKKAAKAIAYMRELLHFTRSRPSVEVGIFEDGYGARKHPRADMTIAQLAKLHENGFFNKGHFVPPRPFIAPAKRDPKLLKYAQRSIKIATGKSMKVGDQKPLNAALVRIARYYAREIRKRLRTNTTVPALVPLAKSTIRGKGHSTPLIETGLIARSVESRVRGKKV